MNADFFRTCERLLSATANGLYQGVAVALLAGLALRFFVRTNAATRHAVWFGLLLFVTALIPIHFLLSRPSPLDVPAPAELGAAAVMPAPADLGSMDDFPPSAPQPVESDASSVSGRPIFTGGGLRGESQRMDSIHLPHWVCLALISAWALLAGIRGGMVLWRVREVRRSKTTSAASRAPLQTLFDALCQMLSARRPVRLRISNTHRTAAVLGFFHPVVLLPADMDQAADPSEVEHVLRHELAHVNRRDDWANLAQQTIQAALFFHPAVWWICNRLSLEREIACDDHVLEAGGRPRAYALTLANVARRLHQCRALLAPGVSNNNSQLQQRITMILNTQRNRSPRLAGRRLGFFTVATAMLAVLAISAGPRLVLAESPEAALPPDLSGPDSGPRLKTPEATGSSAPVVAVAPNEVLLVAPAAATVALPAAGDAFAPIPPEPPASPAPPEAAPSAAGPVAWPNKRRHEMSVEERLDRIERILDRLESRAGHHVNDGQPMAQNKRTSMTPGDLSMNFNIDAASKIAAEQAERAAEEVQRAVEASQRAAEAGQRAADQATRNLEKLKNKDIQKLQDNLRQLESKGSSQELQALREAREALQDQLKNMDRQIRRLEQGQKSKSAGSSDTQPGNNTPPASSSQN